MITAHDRVKFMRRIKTEGNWEKNLSSSMQHVQKACRTNRRDRNDKDNFTNQKDNLKIIGIGKHLPIITLDVNNLNLPMRRQRLGDWTENKTHSLWSLRTYLTGK